MVIFDTKEREWYYFKDFNLADDNLEGITLRSLTLIVNAPSPLFEWESRLTHILANNQGKYVGFSTTGRGYAVEIGGNNANPYRCMTGQFGDSSDTIS